MNLFNTIFKRQNSKFNLPIFGKINFDKSQNSESRCVLYKDDYIMDNSEFQLELSLNNIDKKSIKTVSKLLDNLETIHNQCKSDYLADFNNEDQIEYINNIYRHTLKESEFNLINQKVTPKQKLSAAFMCSGIVISEKNEGIVVNLNYTYGYELQLKFVADKNLKLTSLVMVPGSSLAKKQFSYFISKFEEDDVVDICGRFSPDWWNSPIKSYYIYLMTKRLKDIAEI
tara:strand:+ start:617 stop:1300 length:684 start_codon:yes stop_codon:yes gene_type:complete